MPIEALSNLKLRVRMLWAFLTTPEPAHLMDAGLRFLTAATSGESINGTVRITYKDGTARTVKFMMEPASPDRAAAPAPPPNGGPDASPPDAIAAHGVVQPDDTNTVVWGYAFEELATVRHRNGTDYTILATPRTCRIEAGAVPAYTYRRAMWAGVGTDTEWVRPQTEMEDGRFVLVNGGPYASLRSSRPAQPDA